MSIENIIGILMLISSFPTGIVPILFSLISITHVDLVYNKLYVNSMIEKALIKTDGSRDRFFLISAADDLSTDLLN